LSTVLLAVSRRLFTSLTDARLASSTICVELAMGMIIDIPCRRRSSLLSRLRQVHDLHPSHAFLVMPDKPARSLSDPDFYQNTAVDPGDEECELIHSDVP
jgi:hypothetical protein